MGERGVQRYRHLARIYQIVETSDGADGLIAQEITVCEPWISLEPLAGRELERARQRDARATHQARTHYRSGSIEPRMRMRCKGRVFEITSAPLNVGERNVELEFLVTESIT